jgi:hypothetical protein
MRVSLLASMALFGWSCASQQHAIASLALSCSAPSSATKFDSSQVEQLAGVYALTLVADSFPSHGARTSGRLWLRVNADTLLRYYVHSPITGSWRRLGERPLVGTLEMNLEAIFAPYSLDPRSTNPGAPGVYFERISGTGGFNIGVQPNMSDGTSTTLVPTLVWPEGFQGRWEPDYGILSFMDPATGKPAHVGGDFCAARTR